MDNWTRRDSDRFLLLLRECANELAAIRDELEKMNGGKKDGNEGDKSPE